MLIFSGKVKFYLFFVIMLCTFRKYIQLTLQQSPPSVADARSFEKIPELLHNIWSKISFSKKLSDFVETSAIFTRYSIKKCQKLERNRTFFCQIKSSFEFRHFFLYHILLPQVKNKNEKKSKSIKKSIIQNQ